MVLEMSVEGSTRKYIKPRTKNKEKVNEMSESGSSVQESEVKYGGIPKAEFIADLGGLLKAREVSPEELLQEMQEMYERYRLAKTRLEQNKAKLNKKIPEIGKALGALRQLKANKEKGQVTKTHFQMSPNVYSKARIECPDKVCLWLGANILLEYSAEEAEELLAKNQTIAEKQLLNLVETLDYVSDQITVTEVNMARVFNYRVKLQRLAKQSAASTQLPAPAHPKELD